MLAVITMIKREPTINVHYGENCWIDIDDLHLEISAPQYHKLQETMHKAVTNRERTLTAQW
jgi:hypothetical protein